MLAFRTVTYCTENEETPLTPLVEAVSEFAGRAAEKLRKQNCLATELLVFMHTSPYRPGAQCSRSVVVPLRRPTDDTLALANAAADGMRYMYVPGFRFIVTVRSAPSCSALRIQAASASG